MADDAYKRRVEERLLKLRDTFSRAAIGDFSADVPLYEEQDEFTETYIGVQVMLEVIRGQLKEMQTLNAELESKLKALRKEDEAKNEFIATLAHEIRNPLSPILSSLEIIELQGIGHPSTPGLLEALGSHVNTIVKLLDDLLDISRITRKKLKLEKRAVELQSIIEKSMRTVRSFAERKQHRIVTVLPEDEIWLTADPIRLEQIFVNVLNNAAKYTEPGGIITVKASREEQHALVSIRDTGIGIAPELLPHIFEPFFQGAGAARFQSTGAGLGIGLALTKQLVKLHNGDIRANSAGAGRGSEFVIRLPLPSAVQLSMRMGEEHRQKFVGRRGALRILIVDDNKPAAEGIGTLLRHRGYDASVVFTCSSALEAIAAWKPHVAFLDIGLPDMDGYELARKIRKEIPTPPKLVALTGFGQPDDKRQAKNAGFSAHLTKPVGIAEIEAAIANVSIEDE